MKQLTLQESQSIAGGVAYINVSGFLVPATGISDKCANVIERSLNAATLGYITSTEAAVQIVGANCANDLFRFEENFNRTYGLYL